MNKSLEEYLLKKILLKIATVLLMAICLTPLSNDVSASKRVTAEVTANFKNGVYTICGKGKMTDSAKPKTSQKNKIKKVVIKKGITSIPEKAFKDCTNVSTVNIPSTVKEIGMQAFAGTSIKSIVIPRACLKNILNCLF